MLQLLEDRSTESTVSATFYKIHVGTFYKIHVGNSTSKTLACKFCVN